MALKNNESIWAKLNGIELALAIGKKVIEEVEKEVEKEELKNKLSLHNNIKKIK